MLLAVKQKYLPSLLAMNFLHAYFLVLGVLVSAGFKDGKFEEVLQPFQ